MKPRWSIVLCSCRCGGRWAWLCAVGNRAPRMMGCVCHHPWTLALRA